MRGRNDDPWMLMTPQQASVEEVYPAVVKRLRCIHSVYESGSPPGPRTVTHILPCRNRTRTAGFISRVVYDTATV